MLALVSPINQGQVKMPSENGYVSLWRDINAQPWANDIFYYGVFTKLMTFVQHKPYLATVNGIQIPLQAGEIAMSYSDVAAMFKQIKNKEHARNIIRKFESLDQIYKREVKKDGVHYGFVIGFKGWKKWQNLTTPLTTPPTTPEVLNLKASEGIENTPLTTPLTIQRNNNDLNNIKDNDGQAHRELIEKAFEHTWKKWKEAKKKIGKIDTSAKGKTFDKKFKSLFNASYFKKHSPEEFKAEINAMCKLIAAAHNIEGFNRFTNMHLTAFLGEKQWRDA
jgi:hypothetical protein